MTHHDNPEEHQTENSEDVAHGVTNEPRGQGDLDEQAVEAGQDKLEQAGAGH
jgi:hypothetical protein